MDEHGRATLIPVDVINQLVLSATRDVVSYFPPEWDDTAPERMVRLAGQMVDNGIRTTAVFAPARRARAKRERVIAALNDVGVQVVRDRLEIGRLVLIDRTSVVFAQRPTSFVGGGGVLVPRMQTINRLVRLADAAEFTEVACTREPNERELSVLRELMRGSTDEVAAKRVGMGLRTYRRHLAALMERLGADNRFQAGVLACRIGWL